MAPSTIAEKAVWGMSTNDLDRPRGKQGFASMSPDRQREIARQGGKAAHQKGVAHEWDSEEAVAAGKKGGSATKHRRYCEMCDAWVPQRETSCVACGASTVRAVRS